LNFNPLISVPQIENRHDARRPTWATVSRRVTNEGSTGTSAVVLYDAMSDAE
jgi:hypothetical protein